MYEDLIKQLRYCASGEPICEATSVCPYYDKAEEETHFYHCVERMMEQAADAIEELQENNSDLHGTISNLLEQFPELGKPKWIPVSERLPEKEDEAVIVWEKQGFALIDWRHDNKWAILDNNCGIATHWMPLSEPPKEEP